MSLNKLHLIERGFFAYYAPTFSLIDINNLTYQVLNSLQSGLSVTDIAERHKLDEDKILRMLDSIIKEPVVQDNVESVCRKVDRITLHVANDCNLRCKYCYANGGNYKQERGLMSMETAKEFVDFCIGNFDQIGHIVFFGGEPMLNLDVMELICDTFKTYHTQKKITSLPHFGIITNGTILNSRVLAFIKENLSFITVSIDGPEDFNDANRIFSDGKGSYNKIAKFIHTIKKETNVTIRYEATFTQYHLEKQSSHGNIANALDKEFNIDGTVIDEMTIEENSLTGYWDDFNFDILLKDNFANMPEGFWSVASAIARKTPKQMCGITKEIFAVGADGEIYPCHMNNGERQNSLGNICGKNFFNDFDHHKRQVSAFMLKNNAKCKKCWAENICGGCAVKWFYDDNTKQFERIPNEELCKKNKKHLENILHMIGYIRKDSMLWEALVDKMRKDTEYAKSV